MQVRMHVLQLPPTISLSLFTGQLCLLFMDDNTILNNFIQIFKIYHTFQPSGTTSPNVWDWKGLQFIFLRTMQMSICSFCGSNFFHKSSPCYIFCFLKWGVNPAVFSSPVPWGPSRSNSSRSNLWTHLGEGRSTSSPEWWIGLTISISVAWSHADIPMSEVGEEAMSPNSHDEVFG